MRKPRLPSAVHPQEKDAKVLQSILSPRGLFPAEIGQDEAFPRSLPCLWARVPRTDRGDLMSNNGHNSTLTPELRSWIDNVVAPALVREYLAQLECEKSLATSAAPAVDSVPAHAALIEEIR